MAREKRITCFFIFENGETQSHIIDIESLNETDKIQQLFLDKKINPYCLSFVLDNNDVTYRAEYLKSLDDFQSRSHLIAKYNMETEIKNIAELDKSATYTQAMKKRIAIREMSEENWIEKHASGTLRKNKRIGFSYRSQYLAERIAYEFGFGFQILPRSQITFGDPITEEDCHSVTEAGWHIERYMTLDIFDDYVEAKYIHASFRDGTNSEGLGIVVRATSAPWVPAGHIIFSIVAEFDLIKKVWKDAINPF